MDVDLTGVILGCTLLTKPEDIYRALIEATAYGTRMIIETFEEPDYLYMSFTQPEELQKRSFMMQIYADVTNREIKISHLQTPARSAMFGAVAAGRKGADTILLYFRKSHGQG